MEKVFLGVLANATDPAVIQCVRGILDFIYYAQFEVQTDETLAQLDAAWVAFHENKKVFEELGVREHFNISKIHNIKHYLDSIRALGPATGFNTKATERLHIDLAKVGYRASNKKGYTKQMTTWLRRREAVTRFRLYLQWVMPDYAKKMKRQLEKGGETVELDDKVVEVEDNDGENDSSDDEQTNEQHQTHYHIAKKPPFPHVSLSCITRDYGAIDFLPRLNDFLREKSMLPHIPFSYESSTFSVYRRLHLTLPPIPEITHIAIKDTVIATKAQRGHVSKQGIKNAVPARFST
ncbi:hypothetical protein C0991_010306, partial [Blastosporella zonata]